MEDNVSQKGKKLWEIIPNPLGGRPRLFTNPEELWELFIKYCRWVDDNPWEEKAASNMLRDSSGNKNNAMSQNVRVLQRAYTLHGFCAYSGIYRWAVFKQRYKDANDGFSEVIHAIEATVQSQQIDGALLHKFDSNLVARLNGIADRQEITGKDGEPFALPKLSEEDLMKAIELNNKMNG